MLVKLGEGFHPKILKTEEFVVVRSRKYAALFRIVYTRTVFFGFGFLLSFDILKEIFLKMTKTGPNIYNAKWVDGK
ncbi:MAG: hypothetical protein AAF960_11000 [Bacteroidota bacterium]